MWAPGQKVDRFHLEKVIGQGGFGITFLAKDDQTGQACVVKTLRADLPGFANQQIRFRQEAFNLLRCEHSHIVKVLDVIQEGGVSGVVMDLIDGDNLSMVIRRQPSERLTEIEALRCVDEIGGALILVHSRNLVHRDVKPLNIMVKRQDGKAILIDFGLARQYSVEDQATMSINGTENYAALEQFNRVSVSVDYDRTCRPYTDVYGLAATLYYMVVGDAPLFNAKSRFEAQYQGKSIDQFMWEKLNAAGISERTKEAIMWGMGVLPIDRPQTVQDFLAAMPLFRSPIQPHPPLPKKVEDSKEKKIKDKEKIKPHQDIFKQLANEDVEKLPKKNIAKVYADESALEWIWSTSMYKMLWWSIIGFLSILASPVLTNYYIIFLSERYYMQGEEKLAQEDYEGALVNYNKAIETNPNFVDAYLRRSDLKIDKLPDYNGALADYDQAIKIRPQDAILYTNRGIIKKDKLGDFKGALADYDRAIEINVAYAPAYNARCICLEASPDLAALPLFNMFPNPNSNSLLISCYDKAIQIKADYAPLYLNRGMLKAKLRDIKGSADDYNTAIEKSKKSLEAYPNHDISADAYYAIGILADSNKDREKAIENLNEAASLYEKKGNQEKSKNVKSLLQKLSIK
jgi:eukaryotic-like serine/threonine-protein kinase